MSFRVMIVGFAMILAAGSVVAFAGEDHSKSVKIEDANDEVSDAKVKAESGKHHKLSKSDFKKVALKDDKVKTFDESAFRDDDEEFDGALDDDGDGDDSTDTSGDPDGSGTDHASGDDSGHGSGDDGSIDGSHDDTGDADTGHSGGDDDSN